MTKIYGMEELGEFDDSLFYKEPKDFPVKDGVWNAEPCQRLICCKTVTLGIRNECPHKE